MPQNRWPSGVPAGSDATTSLLLRVRTVQNTQNQANRCRQTQPCGTTYSRTGEPWLRNPGQRVLPGHTGDRGEGPPGSKGHTASPKVAAVANVQGSSSYSADT